MIIWVRIRILEWRRFWPCREHPELTMNFAGIQTNEGYEKSLHEDAVIIPEGDK